MAELNPPVTKALMSEIQTPEGQTFMKSIQANFEEKYRDLLSQCRTSVTGDTRGFFFFLQQDADGKLSTAYAYPASAFSQCFSKSAMNEKPTFVAPPKDGYWSRVVVRAN